MNVAWRFLTSSFQLNEKSTPKFHSFTLGQGISKTPRMLLFPEDNRKNFFPSFQLEREEKYFFVEEIFSDSNEIFKRGHSNWEL